jgi:uncharacterized membrane protein YedE/YeeE
MTDFTTLLVNGIPLVFVVFGLVEFIKALGLTGKILMVISLLVGLGLGLAYQVATNGTPSDFAGWFAAIVFGLALGLVASGFYDFVNDRLPAKG